LDRKPRALIQIENEVEDISSSESSEYDEEGDTKVTRTKKE
jgi:hypothetical protein